MRNSFVFLHYINVASAPSHKKTHYFSFSLLSMLIPTFCYAVKHWHPTRLVIQTKQWLQRISGGRNDGIYSTNQCHLRTIKCKKLRYKGHGCAWEFLFWGGRGECIALPKLHPYFICKCHTSGILVLTEGFIYNELGLYYNYHSILMECTFSLCCLRTWGLQQRWFLYLSLHIIRNYMFV